MDWSPNYILRFSFLLILLLSGPHSYSQNLISNPGFEILPMGCPHALGDICWGYAPPWECGNEGTPDLYNECAMGGLNVPNNILGFQAAHSGQGYAGFLGTYIFPNHREYLLTTLTQPLIAGTWYDLVFYLSLPEQSCGIEKIGAYFSTTSPFVNTYDPLPVNPQIETHYGFMDDMVDWMVVTGCYQATGGEVFLTIGNFQNDANTPLDPNCDSSFTYYYIDDVSLTEGEAPEEIDIDLNGPVTECFSYEIDPQSSGPYFSWSEGGHDPTLVVTSSGIYTVTVTDGCNVGTGSIDVTIIDAVPDIDLGPPDITICNGDEYTISLDPDLGDFEWSDGSSESEYTITMAGIYTVTVSNICNSSSDQVNVVVMDPPNPIDLGEDVILCMGDEINFDFDPDLGDFEWDDHTTDSEYTITQGGTYSLTVSNMCGEVTDEILVTDLNLPELDLGNDVQVLCSGDIIDIELDPALGDYLWQDGSNELQYAISSSGLYSVTVTNICGSGSDQIQVIYYDAPVFDLGPDVQLCAGDTMMLNGNGVVGNYQWQDNSSGNTFEVTASGIYALTLTTGCGTATDSVNITYTVPIVPPDLGMDFTLCPGETRVLYVSSPGADFIWQDGSAADSFLITTSGSYSVHVYNTCESYYDTVHVNVNSTPPQLDLPVTILLCQGSTVVLNANMAGVTYLWNDNSQNDSLLISNPGTYSLTVTNACGTDQDTVIVMDGGQQPFVSLGNDVNLCPGETLILAPQSGDVTSWLWNNGSTDTSYTLSGNEIVSVQVSNTCGTAYDTLIVSFLPATPPLDLGSDTSLCASNSFEVNIVTPDVDIIWSDGSTDSTLLINSPGIYFASISNSCGENVDTIVVNSWPPIPPLNLGIDQSLCPGEIIALDPGIDSVNYVWQDGSTFSSFNATQAGNIYLTISNSCGSSSDTIIISESTEGPQVNLGADINGCEGDEVTLVSDISGVDFLWQDGSILSSLITSNSGTFILNVSNNCGMDADTIVVDIHGTPPQTNLGADTLLCAGNTLLLVSTADAETDVEWQDGSGQSTYLVNSAGTYYLDESNHCGTNSDTIHVDFKSPPVPFDLGPDTTLCPGESLILNAPLTSDLIQWQDGSDDPAFLADKSQTYSLQISNSCGTSFDEFILAFDDRIPVVQIDPVQTLCPGDVIELNATQLFPVDYLWNTGSTLPVIQISVPGNYSVLIQAPCAQTSGETEIIVTDSCFAENSFYVPNVFSPNGDNINDVFSLSWNQEIGMHAVHTNIFDRWGNLVFHSDDVNAEWSGDFNGKQLNPGVYVYQIELQYFDKITERTVFLHGDVTLLR